MTSQDWFNPSVQPPASLLTAPSTAPTDIDIRPILLGSQATPLLLQRGGGYQTSEQALNPLALSPTGPSPASSIYGGADLLSTFRPSLLEGGRRQGRQGKQGKQGRQGRQTLRKRGGGTLMPQQWYNPGVQDPVGTMSPLTTAASPDAIRPVLMSTFVSPLLQQGGTTRRMRGGMRGGFSPSVMGSFAANAQSAIVPLVLYGVYKLVAPEKKQTKTKTAKTAKTAKTVKTIKSSRR